MRKLGSSVSGFSLVECVLALGIIAVAIIPMIALLPTGFNSTRNSTAQTGATNLLTAVAADIRASANGKSPRFSILTSSSTAQTFYFDESMAVVASQADARFKVVVQSNALSSTLRVNGITVSWPPQASSANTLGSLDTLVSVPNQ